MKIKSSIKVALVGVSIIAVGYFGWNAYTKAMIGKYELTPIEPGTVNIVAIKPDAGYRIVVHDAHGLQPRTGGLNGNHGRGIWAEGVGRVNVVVHFIRFRRAIPNGIAKRPDCIQALFSGRPCDKQVRRPRG